MPPRRETARAPSKKPFSFLLLLLVLLVLHVLAVRASSAVLPSAMPEEEAAAAAAPAAAAAAASPADEQREAPGTCSAAEGAPRGGGGGGGGDNGGGDKGDKEEERFEGLDNPSIVVSPDTPLLRVPVLSLRPTQLAVGKHSVGLKAAKVAKKRSGGEEALDAWLRRHPVPCVRGPPAPPEEGAPPPLYLIDHHHLAAALHSLGVEECYAAVVRDYSSLPLAAADGDDDQQQQQQQQQTAEGAFWRAMRRDGCLWPHDENGKEIAWEELPRRLPRSVAGLKDDPYRSLAGLVRRAGGYEKSARPFAEFVWANHLRARVPLSEEEEARNGGGKDNDTNAATTPPPLDVSVLVPLALAHASRRDAEGLPGFTAAAA